MQSKPSLLTALYCDRQIRKLKFISASIIIRKAYTIWTPGPALLLFMISGDRRLNIGLEFDIRSAQEFCITS